MFKTWITTIVVMVAVAANLGSAFVVDRSASAGWDSAPGILDTDNQQKGSSSSMDRVLNGKMQLTGMDKVLQSSSEAKKELKKRVDDSIIEEAGSTSRDKRSEVVIIDSNNSPIRSMKSFKDVKDGVGSAPAIKFFSDNNNSDNDKQDSNNLPRNVVLLLIDETNNDNQNLNSDNFKARHQFNVQGFLQSCRNNNENNNNIQLKYNRDDDSMIFENKKTENNDCECEHFLRTNIGALLSWARSAKIMSTGAVSVTNFSIPAAIGYETGSGIYREFDENNVKREIQKTGTKPEFRDAWRLIDMDRKAAAAAGSSPSSSSKTEGGSQGNDGMWDVFDMFSRIRVAFFRTLLDSLGGNLAVPEDEFPPRRSASTSQSNLADLVADTIKELKSASNEKGYMLVAAAPGNDLSSTVDLLNNEISQKDTLLVVAGICSKDKKPVPFYASGPGAKSLLDARSVWDLPGAIKTAVAGSGCRGSGCRVRRHEQDRMILPRDVRDAKAAAASLIPTADDSGDSPSLRRVGRQEGEEGAAAGISADFFTVMLSLATSVVATFAVKF